MSSSSQPPQNASNEPSSSQAPKFTMKPVSLPFGGKANGKSLPQPTNKTTFSLQSSSSDTHALPSPSLSNNQTLARRPHQNLHHDSDDSEDDDGREPVFEAVSGFDTLTGKSISADGSSIAEKQPLTIPVASGNNWRDRPGIIRRPKGKNLLPKEVQAMQEAQRKGNVQDVETTGPSMVYGLTFAKSGDGDGDQPMGDAGAGTGSAGEGVKKEEEQSEEAKPLTEDEIALRALVSESKGEVERRSDLIIESRRANVGDEGNQLDDEEHYGGGSTGLFRADVAARPESATLDQYNAIPVEEFGAALLRGMGWKEGQAVGKGKYDTSENGTRATTPRIPPRRPGFLGIGAKDVSGEKGAEVELGAWGKAAMRKGSRKAGESGGQNGERNTDGVYMPVMMRNTKTGETITEEELALRKKDSKKPGDEDDWKERRDRNLERNGRENRDRDRDRDRDSRRRGDDSERYDSRRKESSRRDRSRSSSDRHSRRRRYEDNGGDARDDRYYRERDGDRERDRDRRERDREGDRKGSRIDDDRYGPRHSSSHSSSRYRDRERDRNRDSERRRK